MTARRLALQALVASVVITGGLAIALILAGDISDTDARILGTTALIALFNLVALPAGALLDRGRAPVLAWATIGLSAAAFAVWEVGVWDAYAEDSDTWYLTAATLTILAVASSQNSVLTGYRRPGEARVVEGVETVARGLGLIASALSIVAVWSDGAGADLYRALGAVVIATLVATITTPILRRSHSLQSGERQPSHRLQLRLEDGELLTRDSAAGSFAEAAAEAIRVAEDRHGRRVTRIHRL